ncbi:cornifelin homolog [Spea bombifrons]|uniref:cornifelin homolog n=1 Tax=Spea bombifrons TaxID=233779 RepID=UPI00234AA933|nr:cornifelin homolog [Spea bombifrons]
MVPVVQAQPMAVAQTVTVTQGNQWATGVCDCCDDCSVCCFAFWCFPCFQCSTANDFGECLCLPLLEPGFLGASFGGCSAPISVAMRAGARERYRIHGSICNDCCLVCWCYSCVWCQLAREIKKRKQQFTIVTAQTTTTGMSIPHPQFIQYNVNAPRY